MILKNSIDCSPSIYEDTATLYAKLRKIVQNGKLATKGLHPEVTWRAYKIKFFITYTNVRY